MGDLQDMMDNYNKRRNEEDVASSIDMSTSFGIDVSLRQGISFKVGLKRGPSQFNVPIKLAEAPSTLKQILLCLSIPIITYYGYKFYYKPYSMKVYNDKVTKTLNEKGLLLRNKRQFALQQQAIIAKESNRNQKIEQDKNGLVILCAFYGDNVEGKLFNAIRKYLDLDKVDDEEDEEEHDNKEEEEEEFDEKNEDEEKEINDVKTSTGKPPP